MKYDAESIYQKYCKNFNLNEGQVEVIKRLLEWTYSKGKKDGYSECYDMIKKSKLK